MIDLTRLLRKNIRELKPYSSARDEFTGEALVYLDANENPYNHPFNRYPDPLQRGLKKLVSNIKNISETRIFIGNGSDEPIDLLIRSFCEPGKDNLITIDPTYGMYQVAADINNIEVRKSGLSDEFQLNTVNLLSLIDGNTKLIFLCSPNNPTGNCLSAHSILEIVNQFNGLVILDEAYIDFAPGKSLLPVLPDHPNLVILQTFSKAWGMAGIRMGMAFAGTEIIEVLNKIKYPYNINILSQNKAVELLLEKNDKENWVKKILSERSRMVNDLLKFPFVIKIYPSDANFLLVKMNDARGIYNFLIERGIVVRDRSKVKLCEGCLRITIGSPDENNALLKVLNDLI